MSPERKSENVEPGGEEKERERERERVSLGTLVRGSLKRNWMNHMKTKMTTAKTPRGNQMSEGDPLSASFLSLEEWQPNTQNHHWGPSRHGALNLHLGQSNGPAWPGSS